MVLGNLSGEETILQNAPLVIRTGKRAFYAKEKCISGEAFQRFKVLTNVTPVACLGQNHEMRRP